VRSDTLPVVRSPAVPCVQMLDRHVARQLVEVDALGQRRIGRVVERLRTPPFAFTSVLISRSRPGGVRLLRSLAGRFGNGRLAARCRRCLRARRSA
jgi:hypothetical protein